jgi:hypothetical protein
LIYNEKPLSFLNTFSFCVLCDTKIQKQSAKEKDFKKLLDRQQRIGYNVGIALETRERVSAKWLKLQGIQKNFKIF